jgi:hypothetical protein
MDKFVCYFYNVSISSKMLYHIHDVLIQDINELLPQTNVSLHYTLRKVDQCVDLFAKLETSSYADFLTHVSPP